MDGFVFCGAFFFLEFIFRSDDSRCCWYKVLLAVVLLVTIGLVLCIIIQLWDFSCDKIVWGLIV